MGRGGGCAELCRRSAGVPDECSSVITDRLGCDGDHRPVGDGEEIMREFPK